MTVGELIAELEKFDKDAKVLATWEGITVWIDVYLSKDNIVLIDSDNNYYKKQWQEEGVYPAGYKGGER